MIRNNPNYRNMMVKPNLITAIVGLVMAVERKSYDPANGKIINPSDRAKGPDDFTANDRAKGMILVDGAIGAAEMVCAARGQQPGEKVGKKQILVATVIKRIAEGKNDGGLAFQEHAIAVAEYASRTRYAGLIEAVDNTRFFGEMPLEIHVAKLRAKTPMFTPDELFAVIDRKEYSAWAESLRSSCIAISEFYEGNPSYVAPVS